MLCTFAEKDAESVYCVPAAETDCADTDKSSAAGAEAPATGAAVIPGSIQHIAAAARIRFICSLMGSVTFPFLGRRRNTVSAGVPDHSLFLFMMFFRLSRFEMGLQLLKF